MDRDYFAEDTAPLTCPRLLPDEPIPYQLTDRAVAAIRASIRRSRSHRCASRTHYLTIHGGQSW